MKVKMTLQEYSAYEYAKKFKSWEHYIIAKDAYLVAAKTFSVDNTEANFEVDVQFQDGSHQLTPLHLGKSKV